MTTVQETAPMERPNELEMLKSKAKLMGIQHSGNIGVDALREKINAKLAGPDEQAPPSTDTAAPNALEMGARAAHVEAAKSEAETLTKALEAEKPVEVMSIRQYMLKEQMKLVRCRITNLDPKKKDLPGEIITVANEYLGTVRKFVPYGEQTDEGFHIPMCIYNFLDSRKFVSISSKKNRTTGQMDTITRDAKELSLEILDPLTEAEIRELAAAQLAAGSVE